jgi:hypothetical protein
MKLTKIFLIFLNMFINSISLQAASEGDFSETYDWTGQYILKDGSIVMRTKRTIELDATQSTLYAEDLRLLRRESILRVTRDQSPGLIYYNSRQGKMSLPITLPFDCSRKEFVMRLKRTGLYKATEEEKNWCDKIASWEETFSLSLTMSITHKPTGLTLTSKGVNRIFKNGLKLDDAYFFHILSTREEFKEMCDSYSGKLLRG